MVMRTETAEPGRTAEPGKQAGSRTAPGRPGRRPPEIGPAPGRLELVRAFVNTLDIEERTDELDSPAALASWLAARGLGGDLAAGGLPGRSGRSPGAWDASAGDLRT